MVPGRAGATGRGVSGRRTTPGGSRMFDRFLKSVVGGIGAARGAAVRVAPISFGVALLVALLMFNARPVWATGRGGAHGNRASAAARSIETNLFRAYMRYVHALNLRGPTPPLPPNSRPPSPPPH